MSSCFPLSLSKAPEVSERSFALSRVDGVGLLRLLELRSSRFVVDAVVVRRRPPTIHG